MSDVLYSGVTVLTTALGDRDFLVPLITLVWDHSGIAIGMLSKRVLCHGFQRHGEASYPQHQVPVLAVSFSFLNSVAISPEFLEG